MKRLLIPVKQLFCLTLLALAAANSITPAMACLGYAPGSCVWVDTSSYGSWSATPALGAPGGYAGSLTLWSAKNGSATLFTSQVAGNINIDVGAIASIPVALSNLGVQAAYTFLANPAGSGASPSAITGATAEGLLLFTQTGAGAVQETLDKWAKDWPITPQDFGCNGQSGTDQTACLAAWALASSISAKSTYCPPGVYQTTASVVFLPFQSGTGANMTPQTWTFDKACAIQATAAMNAVVQFGSGSSYSYLIRNGLVQGGLFDGNHLAYAAVWAPLHNNITFRDTLAKNGIAKQYRFGDVNSITSSYGATISSADTFTDAPAQAISAIAKLNPAAVTTSTNHGLATGQVVWIEAATGMTQVNNAWYQVTVTGPTTFTLNNIDATGWGVYTGGAYTYTTNPGTTLPFNITGVSSAASAVVTFSTAHSFTTSAPYNKVFLYGIQSVGSLIVDGLCTVSAIGTYTVTCSNINTSSNFTYTSNGVGFLYAPPITITGISNAAAAVVTAVNTFANTQTVFIEGVVGMGGKAYGMCTVASATGANFVCSNWNSTAWGAYSSGGQATQDIFNPVYGAWFENASNGGLIGPSNFTGNTVGWSGLPANGLPYDGPISGAHFWNLTYNGEILSAVDAGGRMHLTNVNVDGPFRFGFRFHDTLNSVVGAEIDYSSYGGFNATAVPVRLESGAKASLSNNLWEASSASYKLLQETVGPSISGTVRSINNSSANMTIGNSITAFSTPDTAQIAMNTSAGTVFINGYGNLLQFSTNGAISFLAGSSYTNSMQINASTGVSVGNTTDPGAGGLDVNGQIYAPNMAGVAINETGYVCWITGSTPSGKLVEDSTTCLASLRKWKRDEAQLDGATSLLMRLRPKTFYWKNPKDANQQGQQIGMIAEDTLAADKRFASMDRDGNLHGWRQDAIIAALVKGFQELKEQDDYLRGRIAVLEYEIVSKGEHREQIPH